MFKKKILIGSSEDTVMAIVEHLEKSNVPFELGIKDILKGSSEKFRSKKNEEIYELFYTVEVRKKYAEQVKAIVAHYVSQQDVKHWFKVAKKKSRKLEKKENALYSLAIFIYIIAMQANEVGKSTGADIVSYIACSILLTYGVFMTIKYYKEMKKESKILRKINLMLMVLGIVLIVYAVASSLALFR